MNICVRFSLRTEHFLSAPRAEHDVSAIMKSGEESIALTLTKKGTSYHGERTLGKPTFGQRLAKPKTMCLDLTEDRMRNRVVGVAAIFAMCIWHPICPTASHSLLGPPLLTGSDLSIVLSGCWL